MTTRYQIATDYQTKPRTRDYLDIYSGPFADTWEGGAVSLPKRDGYMVTLYNGKKIRVSCPVGRTDENYRQIDAAINDAINKEAGK